MHASRLALCARFVPFIAVLVLEAGASPVASLSTTTIYRHVTVIDVAHGRRMPNMAVSVNGERISAVISDKSTLRVTGFRQVDLSGKYIIPGLIDAHVHLATPPNRRQAEAILRRDLYGGVTTVRDMADDLRQVSDLARAALIGEVPAPDIYYAALLAGPVFFSDPRTHETTMGAVAGKVPWMQAIDDGSDLRMSIALARGTSASAVKLYADLSPELARKATQEAHRQGMMVWVHATLYPARPQDVIAAGVDSISHVGMLVFAAFPPIQGFGYYLQHPLNLSDPKTTDDPIFLKLFKDMRERHIVLDATLHEEIQTQYRGFPAPAVVKQLLLSARRSGVDIATGTDFVGDWKSPWPELHEEMRQLSAVGLTTAEVLRSATQLGARALAQESNLGSVEPGKIANLVVLAADPLLGLDNLRTPALVVKRGREYPRADYKPLVRDDIRNY